MVVSFFLLLLTAFKAPEVSLQIFTRRKGVGSRFDNLFNLPIFKSESLSYYQFYVQISTIYMIDWYECVSIRQHIKTEPNSKIFFYIVEFYKIFKFSILRKIIFINFEKIVSNLLIV